MSEKYTTYHETIEEAVEELFWPMDNLANLLSDREDDLDCIINAFAERARCRAKEFFGLLEKEIGTVVLTRAARNHPLGVKPGTILAMEVKAVDIAA